MQKSSLLQKGNTNTISTETLIEGYENSNMIVLALTTQRPSGANSAKFGTGSSGAFESNADVPRKELCRMVISQRLSSPGAGIKDNDVFSSIEFVNVQSISDGPGLVL
jgi:hypothetical protein